MKKGLLILVIALFNACCGQLLAQTDEIAILKKQLEQLDDGDTIKIDVMLELASANQSVNPENSLWYINKADSLVSLLNYEKGIAEIYNQRAEYNYTASDYDLVLKYSNQSLTINKSFNNQKGIANNLRLLGNANYFLGNTDTAIFLLEQSLEYATLCGDSLLMCYSYASLGTDYSDLGNTDVGLAYELKALEIAKLLKNDKALSLAYNDLGVVYGVLGNWVKSFECYQKSMLIDERLKDFKGASIVASNIALVLMRQESFKEAIEFSEKGLHYANQINFKTGLCYNYEYLGLIYKTMNELDKAWDNMHKTLKLQQEIGNHQGIAIAYKDLAELYLLQSKTDSALHYYNKGLRLSEEINYKRIQASCYLGLAHVNVIKKQYDSAIIKAEKALAIAQELGTVEQIKACAELLAQMYAKQDDFKQAYNFHQLYKAMSDSLFNADNVKKIANLEHTYKYEQEKEQLRQKQWRKDKIQEEEIEKQKVVRNSFIIAFGFMILLALFIMSLFMEKRKANLLLSAKNHEINKQSKELNIKNNALNKLSEFKEDMTNMVIHDLKTPLSVILNIHLISNQERRLEIVKHSGYKMMNLIQNVLDVYKYESTKIELVKEPIDVLKIIDLAIEEVLFMSKQKELTFSVLSTHRLTLNADSSIIQRVFVNMLSNAVKFSSPRSQITIDCEILNETEIKFSINNKGSNIPKEKQQHIFEKFGQHERKKTGRIGSTGLGLTFCKFAIKAHEGSIGVTSNLVEGTTFWFVLPDMEKGEAISKEDLALNKSVNNISLTKLEKQKLKPFYTSFMALNVLDVVVFKDLFEQIYIQNLGNVKWVKAVENSIYNSNQNEYSRLIGMIIE